MEFIDVFSFNSTRIMLGLLSSGSAEADVGCGGNLNNDLVASCQKYFCQKLKSGNLSSSYN